MVLNGDGVKLNKKEASKYLKKASDSNNAEVCAMYVMILENEDRINIVKFTRIMVAHTKCTIMLLCLKNTREYNKIKNYL